MTAATGSTTTAQSGRPLSEGGREAPQDGPPEGRSATAARPVPASLVPTPATLVEGGRTVVPQPRPEAFAAVVSDGSATTSAATVATLSPQAGGAKRGDGRTTVDQSAPVSATLARAGTKPAGRAPVPGPADGGSGSLPDHLAPASATVVEGGAEPAAVARVNALTGGDRAVLLDQIARAYPDVVEHGFELVAQWHAECAERRRRSALDRKYAKRRIKRAEAANHG